MATGADLLVSTLQRSGVSHIFGNPGTTELPLVDALAASEMEYVLGLHEDVAVGAAAGYAVVRRDVVGRDPRAVGVVNLHATPGLAHGLGNLYGAAMAGLPLVVTAGIHATGFQHEEPKLSGDLVGMAEQFATWAAEVKRTAALPAMLRRAFRAALSPPAGPAFLALPVDVLTAETSADPEPVGPVPDAGSGDETALDGAAALLADADDVALVMGDHAAASDGVPAAAERFAAATGARVHSEMLTSAVAYPFDGERFDSPLFPDERAAEQMAADAVVWVACTTNTTLTAHDTPLLDPDAASIHLGPDPGELGKTVPVDAAVTGDPATLLDHLADRLVGEDGADPTPATRWAGEFDPPAAPTPPAGTDAPTAAEAVRGVRAAVPDALVVDEGSSNKYAAFREWPFAPSQYLGNKGAGLGYGLPVAVGAALAEREGAARGDGDAPAPDGARPVVCLVGDGSYLYYPSAMYTAARRNLDVRAVVLNNGEYRILRENAAAMLGGDAGDYPELGMGLSGVEHAANATSYGVDATVVESAGAVADAAAEVGPRVLDVRLADYQSG
jgi:benzoylformate decarboxylase